mgnify:CR=1 FL=1
MLFRSVVLQVRYHERREVLTIQREQRQLRFLLRAEEHVFYNILVYRLGYRRGVDIDVGCVTYQRFSRERNSYREPLLCRTSHRGLELEMEAIVRQPQQTVPVQSRQPIQVTQPQPTDVGAPLNRPVVQTQTNRSGQTRPHVVNHNGRVHVQYPNIEDSIQAFESGVRQAGRYP